MYRLLIVDDEELIVNGLYEILTGLQHLDLDVYKAYSGEEAIRWLSRTRMDIVLSDIQMPEMNGLQLLDEIIKRWPYCKVIFLTGHSEFDYIYRATQHPDVEYILKTEDNEKVISVVEQVIQRLHDENTTEELIREAKQHADAQLDYYVSDYLFRVLHGENGLSVTNAQFAELKLLFNADKPLFLALAKVPDLDQEPSFLRRFEVLHAIRHIILRYLAINVKASVIRMEGNILGILVQPLDTDYSPEVYGRIGLFLQGTLEVIQNSCQEALHAKVDFVYGDEACAFSALANKYRSLRQLLNYRMDSNIESLLGERELNNAVRQADGVKDKLGKSEQSKLLEDRLRKVNMAAMQQSLELGHKEQYFELLDALLSPMEEIQSVGDTIANEAYQTLSLLLISHINRWNLSDKVAGLTQVKGLNDHSRVKSWSLAVQYLRELSESVFAIQDEEQKQRVDITIAALHEHIQNHLREDLSLVSLSELVYLNPSYLSRLYKQATGMNLSEYIDTVRSKKAKRMLWETQEKISEIAKGVGYDNATSFTRFFRKVAGMSPQEYRDNCVQLKFREECKNRTE